MPKTMETLKLDKLECARRQLETAINLFFQDGDAVSIHTLTCAAYNVIRDVNNSRNGNPMFAKERYVQMGGKPSLSDFNEPENFFKHADRDPDDELTFKPKFTECLLVDACEKYGEITAESVPEFLVFMLWLMCQAPEAVDIPEGWKSFADDAKELHSKGDRQGFYNRLIDKLTISQRQ